MTVALTQLRKKQPNLVLRVAYPGLEHCRQARDWQRTKSLMNSKPKDKGSRKSRVLIGQLCATASCTLYYPFRSAAVSDSLVYHVDQLRAGFEGSTGRKCDTCKALENSIPA